MKPLFSGTASAFPYSLVGQKVRVTSDINGRDFGTVYPKLSPRDTFIVTKDNEGQTLDHSGIRIISFLTSQGPVIYGGGNAGRFDVVAS